SPFVIILTFAFSARCISAQCGQGEQSSQQFFFDFQDLNAAARQATGPPRKQPVVSSQIIAPPGDREIVKQNDRADDRKDYADYDDHKYAHRGQNQGSPRMV